MVCAYCGGSTDVINSREQKRSNQVWRRRQCQGCRIVFTTHEIIYLPQLFKVKTAAGVLPLEPVKLINELAFCLRHRQDAQIAAQELSAVIIRNCLKNASDGLILANNISLQAAKLLKAFDKQAYLRLVAEHPSLH